MPYPRQCPAPGNRDDASRQEKMTVVARYPDSTKTSLEQRLRARARDRWPQIASLHIRHRGNFSYVDATLTDGSTLKLCRLRYVGSASQWQFAIYRASHDDYDESVFFTGLPVGTCQDALDTACGLYLNDPTAWTRPPTNLQARPLSASTASSGAGMLASMFAVPEPERVLTAQMRADTQFPLYLAGDDRVLVFAEDRLDLLHLLGEPAGLLAYHGGHCLACVPGPLGRLARLMQGSVPGRPGRGVPGPAHAPARLPAGAPHRHRQYVGSQLLRLRGQRRLGQQPVQFVEKR